MGFLSGEIAVGDVDWGDVFWVLAGGFADGVRDSVGICVAFVS